MRDKRLKLEFIADLKQRALGSKLRIRDTVADLTSKFEQETITSFIQFKSCGFILIENTQENWCFIMRNVDFTEFF